MKDKIWRNHTLYLLCWLFKRMPAYVLQYFLYALCTHSLSVVGNVLMLKYILEVITSGKNEVRVLYAVAFFCVYVIAVQLYRAYFAEKVQKRAQERLTVVLLKEVYDKAVNIDMIDYEKPDFYNRFLLATDNVESQIDKFLASLANFFAGCCNLFLTAAVFLSIDIGVLAAAMGTAVITIVMNKPILEGKKEKKAVQKKHIKEEMYYFSCFYLKEYSKELRISGLSDLLLDYDRKNAEKFLRDVDKSNRALFRYSFFQQAIMEHFFMSFLLCGYLVYKVMVTQTMTIAGFTTVFTGIRELVTSFVNVREYIANIIENEIFIGNFRAFLEYRPQECSECSENLQRPCEPFRELSVRHLHFSYPQHDREILSDINMDIRAHKKIALVGRNGCGKSTLVMNLLRLYPASSGNIYLNGRACETYRQEDYRRYFMVLFQDYTLFPISVAENISMDTEWDENKVCEILGSVGLERFSSELQKSIYSEFSKDGAGLSGGQMQRLAIGRVMYSDSEIFILDEPSSTLDAFAEERFNKSIEEASKDRTVVFISHRLTSVRIADVIYVMDDGKIVERGTHEELLKEHSLYEQMWKIQTTGY